jgi:serine/threonine-protein kinase
MDSLGGYQIKNELGQGGMAITYRAYQPEMDRQVAIKVMRADLAASPEFVERFLAEVRTIARLEHPRILPVYNFGREGDTLYLVMRLVEGGTLRDLMRGGNITHPEINRFIGQIASALDYAHKRNVLHCDLKPTNLLIDQSGELYLADFGIAQLATAVPAHTLGTPEYMSPEQCAGEALDARSDVYALGVVLYELLTGAAPFRAEQTTKIFDQHRYSPLQVPTDLPADVCDILLKALAKKKEERFDSAGALAQALTVALQGLPPLGVTPSPLRQDADQAESLTRPHDPASPTVVSLAKKWDATWVCGLCGASLNGLVEGAPCKVCSSQRPMQKLR